MCRICQGCVATSATVAEAELAIREAIKMHIAGLRRQDGEPVPPSSSQVEGVDVAA